MSNSIPIHIYSKRRSRRLKYVLKELFERRIDCGFVLHHDTSTFDAAEGVKIFYGIKKTQGPIRIRPAKLLFEKRLASQDIEISTDDDLPLLFADKNSDAQHDVFAACFYLLSRYEEYLPHRSDEHGRFVSTSSIAHRTGFKEIALVERYLQRFLQIIESQLGIKVPWNKSPSMLITVDVDQLWQYQAKGLARTAFGFVRDLIKDQKQASKRLQVLSGQAKEPLDIYDRLVDECSGQLCFFIQVGNSSRFDHNNPIHFTSVQHRINELASSASIGLHPSYFSADDAEKMQMECERFRRVTNTSLTRSRQHYLRFKLPHTFQVLQNLGIQHDYSMMHPDAPGFRAGTSHPFLFYDLEQDRPTSLEMHPGMFMDLQLCRQMTIEQAMSKIDALCKEVKETNGEFIAVFHPECLIGIAGTPASQPLLDHVIKQWNHEAA